MKDKNEKNISLTHSVSMKNLEKMIKLLIKFNELRIEREEKIERKNMFMKNKDMKHQ